MQPLTKRDCPESLLFVYLYAKMVGKAPESACGLYPGQLHRVCAVRPKVVIRLSKMRKHASRVTSVQEKKKKKSLKVLKALAQSEKSKN